MVLLSFYRFPKNRRWWAFRQMGLTKERLSEGPRPQFAKFLGTGAGQGFSMKPDFRTYGHLTVWDTPEEARSFLQSPMSRDWQSQAEAHVHLDLNTVKAHGKWHGRQPFPVHHIYQDGPLAVMTRARIRTPRLLEFWRHVPRASRSLTENEEVLFSKGVGELPWVEQATFSIWPSKESMFRYAYEGDTHRKIIEKTRKRKWYSEELFVEFVPKIIENDGFIPEGVLPA